MLRSLRGLALVSPSFISFSFGWGTEDDAYLLDAQLFSEDMAAIHTHGSEFGLYLSKHKGGLIDHCKTHDGFDPFLKGMQDSVKDPETGAMLVLKDILGEDVNLSAEFGMGLQKLVRMGDSAHKDPSLGPKLPKNDVELKKLQRSVFKDVNFRELSAKCQPIIQKMKLTMSAIGKLGLVGKPRPRKDIFGAGRIDWSRPSKFWEKCDLVFTPEDLNVGKPGIVFGRALLFHNSCPAPRR